MPFMGGVHVWLPGCSPGSSQAPCSVCSLQTLTPGYFQRVNPASQMLSISFQWAYHALLFFVLLPSAGVQTALPFLPLPTHSQQTHPLWTGDPSLPCGFSELEGEESLSHPPDRESAGGQPASPPMLAKAFHVLLCQPWLQGAMFHPSHYSIPLLALPQDGEQHGQSHSPASYSRSSICGTPSSPPQCGVSSSCPPAQQPGGRTGG